MVNEGLEKIIQGLAEKDDNLDKIQFDNEAIAKVITDRNKPMRNY
jgi:hypothetical protein